MQTGEVIRKYRKLRKLTQEEMAARLGVTAPAVNKWENGNSMPDVTLLAPIARLLKVSLEELLCFREELTERELQDLIQELGSHMKTDGYQRTFDWARELVQQYPGSEKLLLYMGELLNAYRITEKPEKPEQYEADICSFLERAMESHEEDICRSAATSLFYLYFQKEEYEKAEQYLEFLSDQNPERKRLQASVCEKTGRIQEAYRLYEELLYSFYTMVSLVLHNLFSLAWSENDHNRARYLKDKQVQAAQLFDMGQYSASAPELELAMMEQDAEGCLRILKQLLEHVDQMDSFRDSLLYTHLKFKEIPGKEKLDFRELLKKNIQEDASLDFLRNSEGWKKLMGIEGGAPKPAGIKSRSGNGEMKSPE